MLLLNLILLLQVAPGDNTWPGLDGFGLAKEALQLAIDLYGISFEYAWGNIAVCAAGDIRNDTGVENRHR